MNGNFSLPSCYLGEPRNESNSSSIPKKLEGELLKKLDDQIEEARELIFSLEKNNPGEPRGDSADIASYRNEMATNNAQIQKLNHFIYSCKKTIQMLKSGRFTGRCRVTGKKIPEARLRVAPSDLSCEGKKALDAMKERNLYGEWVKSGRYITDQGLNFLGVKK